MTDKMLLNRGVVFGASEATYNVDAVDALITGDGALTALSVYDDISHVNQIEFVVPNDFVSSAGGIDHHVYEDHTVISGTVPLRAGVGANFTPNYIHMWEGANFKVTASGGKTIASLMTRMQRSYTEYVYYESSEETKQQLAVATGIRNNIVINLAMGQEPTFSRNGVSPTCNDLTDYDTFLEDQTLKPLKDADGATVTFNGSVTRDEAAPLRCAGVTLLIGSEAYPIESLSLDLAWTPNAIKAATASPLTFASKLTRAANVRPNGGFLLKDGGDALADLKAKYRAGTPVLLQAVCSNGTSKFTLDIERIQLGYYTNQNQNGLMAHQTPFFVSRAPVGTSKAGDMGIKATWEAAA